MSTTQSEHLNLAPEDLAVLLVALNACGPVTAADVLDLSCNQHNCMLRLADGKCDTFTVQITRHAL